MTIEKPAGTPAKIPVFATIRDVIAITFGNLLLLVRFAWPWLVALVLASGALYYSYYEAERAQIAETGSGHYSLWALTFAVSTIIGALIAVPWHRSVLLGEHQTLDSGSSITKSKLVYAAKAMALMAALLIPIILAILLTPDQDTAGERTAVLFEAIAFTIAFLAGIFLLNRISLILPATAVEDHAVTLRRSWTGTRGNTLRLALIAVIATILPMALPLIAAFSLAPAATALMDADTAPSAISYAITNVIWELFSILTGMLYVTFLSLAYRHFLGLPVQENTNTTPAAP